MTIRLLVRKRIPIQNDAGLAAVELAILSPALLGLVVLIILAGRVAIADNALDVAARDAARAASISRTGPQAEQAAITTAQQSLLAQGIGCDPVIDVNVGGFTRPVGEPAEVTVAITCNVQLADLTMVGIVPGNRELEAEYRSPIDPYRGTTDAD